MTTGSYAKRCALMHLFILLLNDIECRGIIVTCAGKMVEQLGQPSLPNPSQSQSQIEVTQSETGSHQNECTYDFYSRFFAPRCGISEDPVTGSAHCCLGPYWSEKLNGKLSLIGYQDSKRGGVVKMNIDVNNKRVKLLGQAAFN